MKAHSVKLILRLVLVSSVPVFFSLVCLLVWVLSSECYAAKCTAAAAGDAAIIAHGLLCIFIYTSGAKVIKSLSEQAQALQIFLTFCEANAGQSPAPAAFL